MTQDWDPGTYDRFRDLRLIPALDLLAAVGRLPPGDVVDLGCGSGAAAGALRDRAGLNRRLLGVDTSPAMLETATATGIYDDVQQADIATWQPASPFALIFCNAVLHWLKDHATLLPRLAGSLAPQGWLAIQMPGQNDAPSHAAWRCLTGIESPAEIAETEEYVEMLEPLGDVRAWETRYYQRLPAAAEGHPVRHFTASTYGRPFLEAVTDRAALEAAYDGEMARAYPVRADGSVLFPFRRVFLTLRRD